MNSQHFRTGKQWVGGVFAAAVLLCAVTVSAAAQTPSGGAARVVNPDLPVSPFSLVETGDLTRGAESGTTFRLQLSQAIAMERFGRVIVGQGEERRLNGSALNYRLDDNLNLQGGLALGESQGNFHALGSIHCQNGVLDAVSYRASNCIYTDGLDGGTSRSINLGANFDMGERASARLNLFRDTASYNRVMRPGMDVAGARALDPLQPGFLPGNALLGAPNPVLAPYGSGENERTGVDLEFQVGFSTDQAGDLVLGLQLTRVLDSGTEGVFYASPGTRNWTIAKPYDAARLSLDWTRGSFSGGLDSYYRSPVDFIGRNTLDSEATFDVHFTWRAPWNASLSVGASNVLGAGADEKPANDTSLVDPFESIYGRIPYVRYKQDL